MAVSIVEYYNGSAWVQANTNASKSATIRVDITEKLGNPRVANITLLNPSANPFGSGSDTYGPLTNVFTDFMPIRIIEADSKAVLFAGKIYSSKQEYDKAFGQILKLYARDNLAELADMPTDDKTELIVSDGTLNTRSKVIQKIIRDSASDPHSSSLMISTDNILTNDTQKFETSTRLFPTISSTVPAQEFDVASMAKQGLKVIAEIAKNDGHEAISAPAKDFGYDYYVDTQYTLGNSNPAADFNYFKRGTRTTFEGTASNFKGLTIEYPVAPRTLTAAQKGINVPMLPDYDFNKPPKNLYTGAVVALSAENKVNDETVTTNTSLEFEILEVAAISAAFIHADPTISTSAWEGKKFARVGDVSTDANKFADYLWLVGGATDTTANLNGAINNSVTTLTIEETGSAGDAGFAVGQIIYIITGTDRENMYVTAVNSNTEIEVIRGWGGAYVQYSGAVEHPNDSTIYRQPIVGRLQYQSTNAGAGYILISFERDTVNNSKINTQKKEFEYIVAAHGGGTVTLTNGNQSFTFLASSGRPKLKYGLNKPLRITGNDVKNIDSVRERIVSALSRSNVTPTDCVINTLPPPFTYLETFAEASPTAPTATVVVLDTNAYNYGARIGMTIAKVTAGAVTAYGYITAINGDTVTAALNTGNWLGYSGSSNKIRIYIPVRVGHYVRVNNVLVNFEGYMFVQETAYTEQAGSQVTMYKGTGVNTSGTTIGLGINPNSIVAAIEGESQKYPRITNVPMGGLGWTFRPTSATNTATFTGTNQTTMTWTGGEFTIGQMKRYKVRADSATLVTTVDSNTTYPKVYKVLFDPDQAPDANGTFTLTFTLEEDYKPDMDHVIMGHARAGSAAAVNAMIIFDGSGTGLFGSRDAVGENAFSAALFKKSLQPWTTNVSLYPGKHTAPTSGSTATPDNLNQYIHATNGAAGTGVNGTISFADNTTVPLNYNNGSTTTDPRPTLNLGTANSAVYYIFFMLADSGDDETSDMTAVTQAIVDRTTTYSDATSDSRGLLAICSTGSTASEDEISIQAFHGKGQNITADVIAANAIVADAIKAGAVTTKMTSDMTGVTMTTAGTIYSGSKVYGDDNAGFVLDGGTSNGRLQIGPDNANNLKWDGSSLSVKGTITLHGSNSALVANDILNSNITLPTAASLGLSAFVNETVANIQGGTDWADISGLANNTIPDANATVGLGGVPINSASLIDPRILGEAVLSAPTVFAGQLAVGGNMVAYSTGTVNSVVIAIAQSDHATGRMCRIDMAGNLDAAATTTSVVVDGAPSTGIPEGMLLEVGTGTGREVMRVTTGISGTSGTLTVVRGQFTAEADSTLNTNGVGLTHSDNDYLYNPFLQKATVTGNSTVWTDNHIGGMLSYSHSGVKYTGTIIACASNTSVTIIKTSISDPPFTSDVAATGTVFTGATDSYALAHISGARVEMSPAGIKGFADTGVAQFSLTTSTSTIGGISVGAGAGIFGQGVAYIDENGMRIATGTAANTSQIFAKADGTLHVGDTAGTAAGGVLIDNKGIIAVGSSPSQTGGGYWDEFENEAQESGYLTSTVGVIKVGGGGAATGHFQLWRGGNDATLEENGVSVYLLKKNLVSDMFGWIFNDTDADGTSVPKADVIHIVGNSAGPYPGVYWIGLAQPYFGDGLSNFAAFAPLSLGRSLEDAQNNKKAEGYGWLGADNYEWSGLYLATQDRPLEAGNTQAQILAAANSTTVSTSHAPADLSDDADNGVLYLQRVDVDNDNNNADDELIPRIRYNLGGTLKTLYLTGVTQDFGTSGQVLQSDGDGTFSWVANAAGGGAVTALNSATNNELVTVGATTTELNAESNLTFSSSVLSLNGTLDMTYAWNSARTGAYGLFKYDTDGGGGTPDVLAFASGQTQSTVASGTAESAFWVMQSESDGSGGSRLIFEPVVAYSGGNNNAWIGLHNPLAGVKSFWHGVGNGEVTSPTLYFYADTDVDTGFYRIAEDKIGVAVDGELAVEFSDSYGLTLHKMGTSAFADPNLVVDAFGNILKDTSSKRYKKNIADLDFNSDIIYQLRPVSFDWKKGSNHDFGLIAEEVDTLLPEIVGHDAEGQAENVKYAKLTVLLLEEVRKLKQEIEELKERI